MATMRRARGTGTVHQRRTGEWCASAEFGVTAHGTRRRVAVYGHTRAEAERRLAALIAAGPARASTPARRRLGQCTWCRERFPVGDLFRGRCGGCYPWSVTTASGLRHPKRTTPWRRFTCGGCQRELWTRTKQTVCVGCGARGAGRRRQGRLIAARRLGTHSDSEWVDLVAAWSGACAYCGRTDRRLTKDHVVPVARGGSELIENVAPACLSCNASKGALTGREFAEARRAA